MTVILGSVVLWAGAVVGAGSGEVVTAGAPPAGASSAGEGCVADGEGVWPQALALNDEIRRQIDARGYRREDTEPPPPLLNSLGRRHNFPRPTRLPRPILIVKSVPPQLLSQVECDDVNKSAYWRGAIATGRDVTATARTQHDRSDRQLRSAI